MIGLRRPARQEVAREPAVGDVLAPASSFASDRPLRVIVFLRHVGCPFAEKTVRALRDLPANDPRIDVIFVGHGDDETTSAWLDDIGGAARAKWVQDPERRIYGACGIGYSGLGHFLGRASLASALALRREGVRNRRASGTRWQKAAAFLVDGRGVVLWKHVPETADQLPRERDIVSAANAGC